LPSLATPEIGSTFLRLWAARRLRGGFESLQKRMDRKDGLGVDNKGGEMFLGRFYSK
jgi:hypothetical protein